MSSAVVDYGVPVAETEAYQELMTRAGRRTGNIPADLMVRQVLACVPAHEWPTRVEALDAVLRRLEAARKDSLRVEARPADGRHLGLYVTRRPARARGLIARSCTGSTRSRAGATALISSRTRWACASTSWSCSSTFTPVRASCSRPRKNRNGATLKSGAGLCWDPIRPLLGLGDWLDRVVWKGDIEPAKARSARAGAGAQVVSIEQGRRRDSEKQPPRQAGPAARAGRRPAQGVCRPQAKMGLSKTPPCGPCSRASASA